MYYQYNKKNKWKQINYRNVNTLLSAQFLCDLYNQHRPYISQHRFQDVYGYFQNNQFWAYTSEKEFNYVVDKIGNEFIANSDSKLEEINKYAFNKKERLKNLLNKIDNLDLEHCSNEVLSNLLNEWYNITLNQIYGMNLAPIEHGVVNAIKKILIKNKLDAISISKLLTFEKMTQAGIEERDLIEIVIGLKKYDTDINEILYEHEKKYRHLPLEYGNEEWTHNDFIKRFNYWNNQPLNSLYERINNKVRVIKESVEEKKNLLIDIDDNRVNRLSKIGTLIGELRDENKSILGKSIVYRNKILDVIECHKDISLKYYFLEEIDNLLSYDEKLPENILEQRENGILLQKVSTFTTGYDAKSVFSEMRFTHHNNKVNNLTGESASEGRVIGKAKIIKKSEDCKKITTEDIMVTYGTDFDFIEGINKSSAILTQEGGLLSHASVICRELSKPCIVGITGLMSAVKDGDELIVDGNIGKIFINRKRSTEGKKIFLNINSPKLINDKSIGNKALNLVRLTNQNIRIPRGVIVVPDYFLEVLKKNNELEEFNLITKDLNSKNIKRVIEVIEGLKLDIIDFDFVDDENNWSVRSSSPNEDNKKLSYAGQYYTGLYISGKEQIICELKKCWESFFKVSNYSGNGRESLKLVGGVIIQEMIKGEFSGIMFTQNPLSSDTKEMLLETMKGDCKDLVAGTIIPTSYQINRRDFEVNTQRISNNFELTENLILKLYKLGLQIESILGDKADIEWTYYHGKIYILQMRPITTMDK